MFVLISERCLRAHGSHMLSEDLNSNGLDVKSVLTLGPMLLLGPSLATDKPLRIIKKCFHDSLLIIISIIIIIIIMIIIIIIIMMIVVRIMRIIIRYGMVVIRTRTMKLMIILISSLH